MEYTDSRGQSPPKGDNCIQLSMVGAHLCWLEENAMENGEAGLVTALAKPFQQLPKYHHLLWIILFHTELVTSKFEGVLKILTEIETIVGGIEDERVQKKDHHKVWDVLGRIDRLDKFKQLAVLKPSQILMGECRVPSMPSGFGVTRVESRSPKQLNDTSQPDLWHVVFNDIVLRCQRVNTVWLLRWAASWTTHSRPMTQEKMNPAPQVRRQP